jgi:DHA1 family tetracycline resistance protein-like MFS transporter
MIFKRIDRRLLILLLVVFVQMLGASMVLPLLPIYARRAFDVPESVVTLLITSFFLAQFIAGPFIGRLSDLYGRLPVLIITQLGTVIAFSMIGLAESVAVLFVARVFDGITGGNIVVAQAYITDITPPRQRTQALGYIFAMFGLGFVIGPSMGGVLASAFGPRVPFFMAAALAAGTMLLTWLMLDETQTAERRAASRAEGSPRFRPAQILGNIPLALILLIVFGSQFSFSMLQSTFALYGEDVLFAGATQQDATLGIGLLLSVIGMGQLITQLFILRRMLARFQEYRTVIIGTVLRSLSMFMLVVIPHPLAAAVSGMLFAIGTGIQLPSLQGLAANSVPDEVRGGVLGVYQSASSLGIIMGSALSGTLYTIAPAVPYGLGGTLVLFMVIPAAFLMWRSRALPGTGEEAPGQVAV